MSITMPVVKHSFLAQKAADLPRIIREAFHIAITGRPGPVVIDVPSDIAGQELTFAYPASVNIPSYKPTYKCNAKQAKAAAALLQEAQRPVVLAGGGVISSGAQDQLQEIAHLLQAPVALTLMGKGAFPAADPLNLGAVGMHGSARSNTALMSADVLLAVGTRLSDRVTGAMSAFAPHAKLIHVDIDPAEIGKLREADVPIVGDAQAVLSGLLSQLKKQDFTAHTQAWLEELAALPCFNDAARAVCTEAAAGAAFAASEVDEEPEALETPLESNAAAATRSEAESSMQHITPASCMNLLGRALEAQEAAGKRTIVTTEVGQHQMWAAQFLSRSVPRSFLSSGGLGTMGFGFPAAIGAALAYPDAQVVCIAGDGSFQMNVQELATARAYGAAVKVMIIDNACLGMVHQWQQFFYEGRYSQTELHYNPDFVALARAFGWQAKRVQTQEELQAALSEMLSSTEPFLLDVVVPSSENVMPMVVPGGTLLEHVCPGNCAGNAVQEGE